MIDHFSGRVLYFRKEPFRCKDTNPKATIMLIMAKMVEIPQQSHYNPCGNCGNRIPVSNGLYWADLGKQLTNDVRGLDKSAILAMLSRFMVFSTMIIGE